jgi:hypothetical protein
MGLKKRKQVRISVKKLKKQKKSFATAYYMAIAAHKFGLENGDTINELFRMTHIIETILRHNKNKHFVVFK